MSTIRPFSANSLSEKMNNWFSTRRNGEPYEQTLKRVRGGLTPRRIGNYLESNDNPVLFDEALHDLGHGLDRKFSPQGARQMSHWQKGREVSTFREMLNFQKRLMKTPDETIKLAMKKSAKTCSLIRPDRTNRSKKLFLTYEGTLELYKDSLRLADFRIAEGIFSLLEDEKDEIKSAVQNTDWLFPDIYSTDLLGQNIYSSKHISSKGLGGATIYHAVCVNEKILQQRYPSSLIRISDEKTLKLRSFHIDPDQPRRQVRTGLLKEIERRTLPENLFARSIDEAIEPVELETELRSHVYTKLDLLYPVKEIS